MAVFPKDLNKEKCGKKDMLRTAGTKLLLQGGSMPSTEAYFLINAVAPVRKSKHGIGSTAETFYAWSGQNRAQKTQCDRDEIAVVKFQE